MIAVIMTDCAAGISYQRAAVVTQARAAQIMRILSVILGKFLIRSQENIAAE